MFLHQCYQRCGILTLTAPELSLIEELAYYFMVKLKLYNAEELSLAQIKDSEIQKESFFAIVTIFLVSESV